MNKVMCKVIAMRETGRLQGLTLADFNCLITVLNEYICYKHPVGFIQEGVKNWLVKNGAKIKPDGIGWVLEVI